MHRVVTPQQQRGRLSRSACRPAKAVGGYDVPNLHNRSWGAVTCHYLGMGIRGHGNTADYSSLWDGEGRIIGEASRYRSGYWSS